MTATRNGLSALAYHGGNLDAAIKIFPDAPKPWIDLSTGLNPWPYPFRSPLRENFARLPEPAAITTLEWAAAQAFAMHGEAAIVAAPGTQALLQWLPRVFAAKSVAQLGFTYAEHRRCWEGAGASVATVEDLDGLNAAEVAVIVNPNNPDGRLLDAGRLWTFAAERGRLGKLTIIDEAFVDLLGVQASLAPRPPLPGLILLRSFGKIFGLAGLRLGFAVGEAETIALLRAKLGPWAVSGPAISIGVQAYRDHGWRIETAARLKQAGDSLDACLRAGGLEPIGATPLFRLARSPEAARIFEKLCEAGILTRPFVGHPDWLRFGVPGDETALRRLAAVFSAGSASGEPAKRAGEAGA